MKHKYRKYKACVVWTESLHYTSLHFQIHISSTISMYSLPPSVPISAHPDDVPIILEQPLEVPCRWCGYYFCSYYCDRRRIIFHGTWMPVAHWQHQYQDPSWGPGPSRNENQMGYREAGTQYPNHIVHESSATISTDGYTGFDLSYAWIGANNETGDGQV